MRAVHPSVNAGSVGLIWPGCRQQKDSFPGFGPGIGMKCALQGSSENSLQEQKAARAKASKAAHGSTDCVMKRRAWLWPLGLCLAVCAAWMWCYDKHSFGGLKDPFQYGSGEAGSCDALQVLTWLRAASEFDFIPFCDRTNHRLGAPSNANWNDFPMYDAPLLFLFGMAARYTDLLTAANLMILFGHLTSAAGFYFACRLLRLHRVWASAGALIWSFSCYHAWRGLGHVCLAYDYAVPPAVVCAWLLAGRHKIKMGDRLFWLCAALGVLIGQGNPYNLNMWLQLLCLSTALRFVTWRAWDDVAVGVRLAGIAVLSFVVSDANHFWNVFQHGANPGGLPRDYYMTELYALKPIELLVPPPWHPIGVLAGLSERYRGGVVVRGEVCSAYLGIVGAAGLLWLCAEFALRLARPLKQTRRCPLHFPQCAWIILYSVIGGGNCLVALLGLPYWRASNRFSIWILAICLLFLVSRLSGMSRRSSTMFLRGAATGDRSRSASGVSRGWNTVLLRGAATGDRSRSAGQVSLGWNIVFLRGAATGDRSRSASGVSPGWNTAFLCGAAAVVTGLAIWDQFGFSSSEGLAEMTRRVRSDQHFAQALENKLPGAMVFQLPIMNFIDACPVFGCKPYDLTRPYLWTKTVRFSHGAILGRPEDRWRFQVWRENAPNVPQVIAQLEDRGFSAICFNRNAFLDHAESAVKALGACGQTEVIEDELHEQVCVVLKRREAPAGVALE